MEKDETKESKFIPLRIYQVMTGQSIRGRENIVAYTFLAVPLIYFTTFFFLPIAMDFLGSMYKSKEVIDPGLKLPVDGPKRLPA